MRTACFIVSMFLALICVACTNDTTPPVTADVTCGTDSSVNGNTNWICENQVQPGDKFKCQLVYTFYYQDGHTSTQTGVASFTVKNVGYQTLQSGMTDYFFSDGNDPQNYALCNSYGVKFHSDTKKISWLFVNTNDPPFPTQKATVDWTCDWMLVGK